MPDFGFLTDCFNDESLLRARALSRSLRCHDPGTRIGLISWAPAVAVDSDFDVVVDARNADPFRGLYRTFNKLVGVGWFNPFEHGLFLDNDTIVVEPLRATIEQHFSGLPFGLNMARLAPATPHLGWNHIDAGAVAREFGLETVLDPDGGGHLYFEGARCRPYFEEAIALALYRKEEFRRLVGDDFIGDEVATAIVANRHRLPMPVLPNLVHCILPGFADTLAIDSATFRARDRDCADTRWAGRRKIVHFCADGKWSGPYGDLTRRVLGVRYPPPPPSPISRLLRRVADRFA